MLHVFLKYVVHNDSFQHNSPNYSRCNSINRKTIIATVGFVFTLLKKTFTIFTNFVTGLTLHSQTNDDHRKPEKKYIIRIRSTELLFMREKINIKV